MKQCLQLKRLLIIFFVIFIVALVAIICTFSTQFNKLKKQSKKYKLFNQQQIYNNLNEIKQLRLNNYKLQNDANKKPVVINRGIPINMNTHGDTFYTQLGVIYQEGSDPNKKILPLHGKQTYCGSQQWYYYTFTDQYNAIRLPVIHKGKSCQDNYGCQEIYDGDKVKIIGYDTEFRVKLYNKNCPKYIPYVY